MSEKMAELLQQLADSIGVTVAELWPYMVRYEFISSIVGVVFMLLWLMIAALSIRPVIRKSREIAKRTYREREGSIDDFLLIVYCVVLGCAGIPSLAIGLCSIAGIFAPEAVAIRSILEML